MEFLIVALKSEQDMEEINRPRNEEELKEEEKRKIPPAADDPNRERLDNDEKERK